MLTVDSGVMMTGAVGWGGWGRVCYQHVSVAGMYSVYCSCHDPWVTLGHVRQAAAWRTCITARRPGQPASGHAGVIHNQDNSFNMVNKQVVGAYSTAADTKKEPYLRSYLNRRYNKKSFVHMSRIVPRGLQIQNLVDDIVGNGGGLRI